MVIFVEQSLYQICCEIVGYPQNDIQSTFLYCVCCCVGLMLIYIIPHLFMKIPKMFVPNRK